MAAKEPQSARTWNRNKESFESVGGKEVADQEIQRSVARERLQSERNTEYHAVLKNMNYLKCPNVRYQDNDESRPYNHGLLMHMRNEGRCLICWAASHKIYDCPHR